MGKARWGNPQEPCLLYVFQYNGVYMKELCKPFVAGFLDGEAYIGLMQRRTKNSPRPYMVKPTIKVAQLEKCREVLDYLHHHYGGYISKAREHHNTRNSIMWEVSKLDTIHQIMLDIQESVIVKKPQVEIMIQYCSLPKMTNILSEENNKIYEQKCELQNQMAKLNKRGLAETE